MLARDLEVLANRIADVRASLELDGDLPCGGLGAMSEQHARLALALLDQALAQAMIASYHRMRGD